MGTVSEQTPSATNPWAVTLEVNGTPIIDTGAEVTVVSEQTHQKTGGQPLMPADRTLCGPDTHTLPVLGQFAEDEHNDRIRNALQRIQDAGVTLNREKCSFAKSTVSGHVVDAEGIRPDPEKIIAIYKCGQCAMISWDGEPDEEIRSQRSRHHEATSGIASKGPSMDLGEYTATGI